MSRERILKGIVESAGLGDLWDRASHAARLPRADLERILASGHPLAASALADVAREHRSGIDVTHPWTLRVRAPGVPFSAEDEILVSHAVERLDGIAATETQIVGELPPDLSLGLAVEMVRTVKVARPDLQLRGFSARSILAIADTEGASLPSVLGDLRRAGLDTLDWEPGDGTDGNAAVVHRAAHEQGFETTAPVGYARGGVDPAFLDRLEEMRDVAESTGRFHAALPLPNRTEGASPLHGTAGTEDALACALTRLAMSHVVKRVTVDAHVVGHKLGAVLLTCGADDLVGAQAAAAWAPPTSDGPRPLNPDRVRRYVIEARRSPVLRNAMHRPCDARKS
jgi:aminodeoxyfutalosine synthase